MNGARFAEVRPVIENGDRLPKALMYMDNSRGFVIASSDQIMS